MMKILKWCIAFTASFILIGCGIREIVGTGKVAQQVRDVKSFSSVEANGRFDVQITIGKPQLVTVQVNENLLPYIETKVKSDTLIINTKKGYTLRPQSIPVVTISVPTLQAINFKGNNQGLLQGVAAGVLKLEFTGSNQFVGRGKMDTLLVKVSGDTIIDTQYLTANKVELKSMGNAKIRVNAKDKLDVDIAGTGSVGFVGNPKINQNVNGSGSITRIQL